MGLELYSVVYPLASNILYAHINNRIQIYFICDYGNGLTNFVFSVFYEYRQRYLFDDRG